MVAMCVAETRGSCDRGGRDRASAHPGLEVEALRKDSVFLGSMVVGWFWCLENQVSCSSRMFHDVLFRLQHVCAHCRVGLNTTQKTFPAPKTHGP